MYGGLGEASVAFGSGSSLLVLSVSPQAGYFISDNTLVGGTVALSFFTDFDESSTIVGLSPFVRYCYTPEATNGLHFYGQAEIGYAVLLNDTDNNFQPLSLGVGATRMLNSSVALDGFLGYRKFDLGSEGSSTLSVGASINMFIDDASYGDRKNASASLQRGDVLIGGTIGALDFGLEEGGGTAFDVRPQLFYFFGPQLAIGGGVRIGFSGNEVANFSFRSTSLGISPQLRYYLSNSGHQLWFLSGGLNIDYTRQRTESDFFGDQTFTNTGVELAVGGGVNSFITPNVALEIGPSLRYNTEIETVRLGVDVGVQVLLNRGE